MLGLVPNQQVAFHGNHGRGIHIIDFIISIKEFVI